MLLLHLPHPSVYVCQPVVAAPAHAGGGAAWIEQKRKKYIQQKLLLNAQIKYPPCMVVYFSENKIQWKFMKRLSSKAIQSVSIVFENVIL